MGFDITDKIKMRAAKTFLPPFVDMLESKLPEILEEKKKVKLEGDEKDIVIVIFEHENKVYFSLTVVDSEKRMTRAIWTKEIKEVLEMFIKSK